MERPPGEKKGLRLRRLQNCHPNTIKDAYIDAIHATHSGSWGFIDMAIHAWWRTCIAFCCQKQQSATRGSTLVTIQNLKLLLLRGHHKIYKKRNPDEAIQIDFGGPIYDEKDQEVYLLACIKCFSKLPTADVFDRGNAQNVLKFLQDFFLLHGIPRAIRLDHAKSERSADQTTL